MVVSKGEGPLFNISLRVIDDQQVMAKPGLGQKSSTLSWNWKYLEGKSNKKRKPLKWPVMSCCYNRVLLYI
jgi:hypothetical protein